MKKYTHLTLPERERIYLLHCRDELGVREIARLLKRDPGSISREVRRNQNNYLGYLPDRAQMMAVRKRRRGYLFWFVKHRKTLAFVKEKLVLLWSPEEIAGRLRLKKKLPLVSHESIYKYIHSRFGLSEGLYQYLRIARRKRGRKQLGRKAQGVRIPDRIGIEQRPKISNTRKRIGDFESDSILFSKQAPIVNTTLERKTRFVSLAKLQRKTADLTQKVLTDYLGRFPKEARFTLTLDNGSEFTNHQSVAGDLGIGVYFCQPYHSWEKGSVENINGLVRQYLPRSTDLSVISQNDLKQISNLLNDRPRKCLGFRTPKEVLSEELKSLSVALHR